MGAWRRGWSWGEGGRARGPQAEAERAGRERCDRIRAVERRASDFREISAHSAIARILSGPFREGAPDNLPDDVTLIEIDWSFGKLQSAGRYAGRRLSGFVPTEGRCGAGSRMGVGRRRCFGRDDDALVRS
jgi:hypothetical protein